MILTLLGFIIEEDKILQEYLKSSLSDPIKNLAWFNAVKSHTSKTITVVEVGVGGGGSLAIAALAITRSLSPILMRGSRIIGFDLFGKAEIFSEHDNSTRLEEKFKV